jgi:ABC-type Fe3+-hydroxamate transport system substrate-binding protein
VRSALNLPVALLGAALALHACAPTERAASNAPIDDFGDTLIVGAPPRRIVSLQPATTEMLFALGAGNRLVGRTTWDLWPDSAKLVPDLGNGIRPNVEAVLAVRPDLVVLYASADNQNTARALRAAKIATLSIKVDRIADFQRVMRLLGAAIGDSARAAVVEDSVMRSLELARAATAGRPRPTVFWHMWDNPLLTIGRGSYLSELVEIAGGRNVYDSLPEPSPQIAFEDLARKDPDIILVAPTGIDRIVRDPKWKKLGAVRSGRVLAVDSALVFRPSVRLGEAALSLARLIHPGSVQ